VDSSIERWRAVSVLHCGSAEAQASDMAQEGCQATAVLARGVQGLWFRV